MFDTADPLEQSVMRPLKPRSADSTSPIPLGVRLIASVGGAGWFPVAPGTVGSAVGVGLYLLLPITLYVQLGALFFIIVLSVWSGGVAQRLAKEHDPSFIVIDEVAGQWIACFMLPKHVFYLAGAFLLFRLFDIIKCFPMKQLERLPGGWGITADDLAAGLLARLCLAAWMVFL